MLGRSVAVCSTSSRGWPDRLARRNRLRLAGRRSCLSCVVGSKLPAPPPPSPALTSTQLGLRCRRPLVVLLLASLLSLLSGTSAPARAEAQVQLRCAGTLLEARGSAELRRQASRLRVSLGLEAEAATADQALEQRQRRLAAVRRELQALQIAKLEVTAAQTWERGRDGRRPPAWVASLQVSGTLALEKLQPLVRRVGGLPGVRLSPAQPQPDPATDATSRRQLLQEAYKDALAQARELAGVMGISRVTPLQMQVEGGLRPILMRAMADAQATPPFDPRELPAPIDRLNLQVSFCAR